MAQMNSINSTDPKLIPQNAANIQKIRTVTVTGNINSLSVGAPLYSTSTGGYGLANNTALATCTPVGMVSKMLNSTQVEMLESGNIILSGLTMGALYYLGSGKIVTPMPTSGFIIFMGTAISTTQLVMNIVPQSDIIGASLFPVGSIVYSIRTEANPPSNCLPLKGAQVNGFAYPQLWKFANTVGLIGTNSGSFKILNATKRTLQLPTINDVHILPNQSLDILRTNKSILGGTLGSVSPAHQHKSIRGTTYTHNSGGGASLFSESGTLGNTPNSGNVTKVAAGTTCEVNAVFYIPYIIFK